MVRIAIDEDLCQGSGECVAIAGSVITQDELGIAHVRTEVADDVAARVVATCPSMAITVVAQ
jgi:ferredoxin